MQRFENPAIVLGGGAITGLGAVRSLGRAGVKVLYLGEGKSAAIYSKYCKKYYIFPRIGRNKDELRRVLLKLKHQIGDVAVLFPATDSYALYLADLFDELTGYYTTVPKKEVIELLINKRKFYQSLEGKVPHPTTHFPENLEDVRKIGKEISYPVFIKPYISQSFSERFCRKGFVANSQRELLRHFKLTKNMGLDMMIQEIVPGPQTDHVFLDGYLDRDSDPKALFARRRLRMWPLDFGNSSLCTSIPISEVNSLKEMLFGYLKSIRYRGIFSAEFKKDHRDGVYKLLEINSRTSAWFSTLCAKCGINIMLTAYVDAIGGDTEYSQDYEAGIKWVFLTEDLKSSTRMFMSGYLSTREWIFSLLGRKDYMSYAKDDLRPFVRSLAYKGWYIGKAIKKKCVSS